MQHRVDPALVARVGAFVFAGVLGMPAALPALAAPLVPAGHAVEDHALVAPAAALDVSTGGELDTSILELRSWRTAARSLAVEARSVSEKSVEDAAGSAPDPTPAPPPPSVLPPPAPVATGGSVLASWYGPGFYGDRTACGQTLTPQTLGVAHLTLRCGTLVTLTSLAGMTVTVPVIDRGPYVAGRTLDLTAATKAALACTDLCHVRMSIP